MRRAETLKYLAGLVIVGTLVAYLLRNDYLPVIRRVSALELAGGIAFELLVYLVSGLRYGYLLRRRHNVRFRPADYVLFPVTNNLWSYIVPFQGSLLYATALLKCKYGLQLATGLVLSSYSFMVSLVVTGAIGLYFAVASGRLAGALLPVSAGLVLSPLLLFAANRLLATVPDRGRVPWVGRVRGAVAAALAGVSDLWRDTALTVAILLFDVLHIIASVVWYAWIVRIFDLPVSFPQVAMLCMIMRVASVLKFTPGNLGVEQLISGSAVALLGGRMGDGVLVSLFVTLSTFAIVFSLGFYSTCANMRYFGGITLSSVYRTIRAAAGAPERG